VAGFLGKEGVDDVVRILTIWHQRELRPGSQE
jgi:hypothetical protein